MKDGGTGKWYEKKQKEMSCEVSKDFGMWGCITQSNLINTVTLGGMAFEITDAGTVSAKRSECMHEYLSMITYCKKVGIKSNIMYLKY